VSATPDRGGEADLLTGLSEAARGSGWDRGAGFAAWRRLFGRGGAPLLALHGALALTAKLTAAAVLPGGAARLRDRTVPVAARLDWIESGQPFTEAGIEGFTGFDPFGWVAEAPAPVLETLVDRVVGQVVAAGWGRRDGPWAGDLFTERYQALVPLGWRRALGEVHTPPWLAAHALDRIGWQPDNELLDPTCGTGVFLLEALRRRVQAGIDPHQFLHGLYGLDLNPLAVLATKASLVVAVAPYLAPYLEPGQPMRPSVRLPVYPADSLAVEDGSEAATIPRVSHLAGNPPWVKWSQLPPDYAAAIAPACRRLGGLGDDTYVGGIETDLSAVITLAAAARWLRPGGRLAFYLTASLFTTAAGRSFRRLALPVLFERSEPVAPPGRLRVLAVEDLKALAPFAGVSAHPALLLAEAGEAATAYPVPYLVRGRDGVREIEAWPLPGTLDGPWLKGTAAQHRLWRRLFDRPAVPAYRARKGVTTDRNGIYFVTAISEVERGLIRVRNDPAQGRSEGVGPCEAVIEDHHLFPLLRGRGLGRFRVAPDPRLRVIVPQRGMHGDPDLATRCPATFAWFQGFEAELRRRASYRRYQAGQPFWSVWSTGAYSFAPWKVLWREMASQFAAAYLGPVADAVLGARVAVPDHKLYFVAVADETEAAYLTGLLNAPVVAEAITAYAATLGLGTSVCEVLRIPPYRPDQPGHQALSALARTITMAGGDASPDQDRSLDRLALEVMDAL
jgi:hypothetical protein